MRKVVVKKIVKMLLVIVVETLILMPRNQIVGLFHSIDSLWRNGWLIHLF